MSLTQLGVVLLGVYLILIGAAVEVSTTLTLIFGIVVAALVLFDSDFVRTYRTRA
jgi:hypothetical protein